MKRLIDGAEKRALFELLDARAIGMDLTEHFAMTPAASVSGIYLAHPEVRYFSVGRIAQDQVADYAARKGVPLDEAERWLRPNLGYEPSAVGDPAAGEGAAVLRASEVLEELAPGAPGGRR